MHNHILFQRLIILFLLHVAVTGCASQNQLKSSQLPLRFIAAVEIDREAKQDGVQIGGLSSASYNPITEELASISDDTGYISGPRVHYFDIDIKENSLSVVSKRMVRLTKADGGAIYPDRIVDAEAMAEFQHDSFLVASEGMDVDGYFDLPGLFEFNLQGKLLGEWPIPRKFMPRGKKMVDFGVRPNDAFESLSLTPDKQILFMANEKAMFQDGVRPTLNLESPVRVVVYNASVKESAAVAEYMYHISPLAKVNNDPDTTGFRSLSDFIALDKQNLIFVEKTFFTKPIMKNSVQLYTAKITPETTNVADQEGVKDISYTPMEKKLWIDLDQFEGAENFPDLDNIEGITFGPALPNGNKTLILLSDNNFSKRQKTLIYAFEIRSQIQ